MNEREALRLALEALEYPGPSWLEARQPAITAIKQALEQPEPEPVATVYEGAIAKWNLPEKFTGFLYSSPQRAEGEAPKREWQGLTDEEIDKTYKTKVWDARRSYARAIEAKLKEKNN